MPEITAAGVLLRVPVVGKLDHRRLVFPGARFVFRSRQEHQRKTALLTALTADFDHTQQITEKVKGVVQITDPNHRVQILHRGLLLCEDS